MPESNGEYKKLGKNSVAHNISWNEKGLYLFDKSSIESLSHLTAHISFDNLLPSIDNRTTITFNAMLFILVAVSIFFSGTIRPV